MASPNYYEVLGVQREASNAEIKKAYRKLALANHPDHNPEDAASEARFKEISEAYAVLGDSEKRAQYDQFGAAGFHQRYSTEDIFRGFDLGSIFSDLGMGGAPGADVFSSVFGGAMGGGQRPFDGPRRRRRAAQVHDVHVGFEEAIRGGSRQVVVGSDSLNVKIPAGVEEGQKLRIDARLPGGGDPQGRPEVHLRIRIAPHPEFTRRGKDIHLETSIGVGAAVLGTTVAVPTLNGEKRVKVPPGTPDGAQLRLRDLGVPASGGKAAGHQFITVRIVVPEPGVLSDEERALFEGLRDREI